VTCPVSVCIIACNEERNLRRCLASVDWADDRVVVVDSRSSDATEAIAREMGARVIVHPFTGTIEQKNVSLEHAKHDWVLALDADEAVSERLAEEVPKAVSRSKSAPHGFEVNRITYHLGRWLRHGDFYPDWQLRLFRRSHGRGELEHYSYRDLADQVARIQAFSEIQARELKQRGRRVGLGALLLRPPARFLRAYLLKRGFLDGIPGLIVAGATAFHVFLKYAKLWEFERSGAGTETTPPGSEPTWGAPERKP
jgi:glycosyltransferase involved in cell wall biosynthesis